MKLPLSTTALSLSLVACSTLNQPIADGGNPLDSPMDAGKKESFSHQKSSSTYESSSAAERFPPGTTVETSFPNAELYDKVPSFGSWGKKTTLPSGTAGRVINYNQGYAQIELENGKIGYIKSQYIAESIVDEPLPLDTDDTSDSIINQDGTAPDLPDPNELGSLAAQVKQQTLSIPSESASEKLYEELSDEEIMKRIRERKAALMEQRETATTTAPDLPIPTLSETTELPSAPSGETIKQEIEVPAINTPKVEVNTPGLE